VFEEDSGVREGSSRTGEKSWSRVVWRSEMVQWSRRAHSEEIAFAVVLRSPSKGSAPREEGVAQRWRLIRISRERDSTSSVRVYGGELKIARMMLWVRLANGRKVVAWAGRVWARARRAEGRRVGESVIMGGLVACEWEVWFGERRWRVASRKGLRLGVVSSRVRVGLEGVRRLKMVERVERERVSVAVGSGRCNRFKRFISCGIETERKGERTPRSATTSGTQLFAHAPKASGLLSTLAFTSATPAHFPCGGLLWRRDDTRVLYL